MRSWLINVCDVGRPVARPRILMLSARYVFGGAAVVIENLAKGLTSLGYEICIGAFRFKDSPSVKGVPTIKLGVRDALSRTRVLDSFDLIHDHQPAAGFVASLTEVPFVYHYYGAPAQAMSLEKVTNLALNKLQTHNYDRIISISEAGRDELRRLFGVKNSTVIYLGVDTQRYRDRKSAKFRNGDPQLLFVGSLYEHKHVETLIDATRRLVVVYPKIHLSVVGAGPKLNYLRKRSIELGIGQHITFWGRVSNVDLPEHYAACDAYVSASDWELFNLPLLEAMASRKPVVASSIPVHLELALKSRAIRIFPTGDAAELSAALDQVLQNPDPLTANGLNYALQSDWSVVAKRIADVYDEVLGEQRKQ